MLEKLTKTVEDQIGCSSQEQPTRRMSFVHIVPGTGGNFYCENCMRDSGLVKAMREIGCDVIFVPLYLPITFDEPELAQNTPIFFGAVNIYLKQVYPFFRKIPGWLNRLFDSKFILKYAAKQAGSVNAKGLEEMTISMLQGKKGNQAEELEHLIKWLATEIKPDVIYLANALLLGLVKQIKAKLNVPIVCALQDEDQWLDDMDPKYSDIIWQTLAKLAKDVDLFLPVSQFYGRFMSKRMQIPDEKLQVLNIGVDPEIYSQSALKIDPPVLGYLSRITESYGLEFLVDAFIEIKNDHHHKNLKLKIAGGELGDDHLFVKKIKKKLIDHNVFEDVEFIPENDLETRKKLLQSLTILSVPIIKGEAFGLFQIEAMAAGVPVVQPAAGAFPEIVKKTGGGIIYEPNDSDSLKDALVTLLSDPPLIRKLGHQGRESVRREFSNQTIAKQLTKIYDTIIV